MKFKVWSEGCTVEESKDIGYWERNMLAVFLAQIVNKYTAAETSGLPVCGWYPHQGDGFEGWSRVISIDEGAMTFHIPDDFDLGNLPEIEPNWDGHDTQTKWKRVAEFCGMSLECDEEDSSDDE